MQKIEYMDVKLLKFHPKNPRTIKDDSFKKLCESIKNNKDYFETRPILCNKDMIVFAGNQRLKAALEIGMQIVPVSIMDISEERQRELMIRDNVANGEWDKTILAQGFKFEELDNWGFDFKDFNIFGLDNKTEEQDEKIPDVKIEPIAKIGDLYQLGNHRLLCGDSCDENDVSKLMANSESELLFTSPPYSDMREYNGDKDLSVDIIAKFIERFSKNVKYQVINLGIQRKNGEINEYWNEYIKIAKSCNYKFLSWNVWNRETAKSIGQMSAMFPIEHEWILVFGKELKKINTTVPNKTAGSINDHNSRRNKDGSLDKAKDIIIREKRELGTVLTMQPQLARNVDTSHPAMFPVSFAEQYILSMTNTGDIVTEPFLGSGSTLIACEKTGRICYGMELDPHYVDIIIKRWEEYTGKTAIKLNS